MATIGSVEVQAWFYCCNCQHEHKPRTMDEATVYSTGEYAAFEGSVRCSVCDTVNEFKEFVYELKKQTLLSNEYDAEAGVSYSTPDVEHIHFWVGDWAEEEFTEKMSGVIQ